MKPVSYSAADFDFNRNLIGPAALEVVQGLQGAGYDGYLVGGCVRDLLLGIQPKDFDVATDATPEEVHAVFRRARIIGRRFRLVHVRYGREIVEVATYRANPSAPSKHWPWKHRRRRAGPHITDRGRLLDDNVYGTLEEDALRRDFTVNALYFDPVEDTILDYLGGVEDLGLRRLRLIGKPAERFAEDPVRMLRVLRFQAKLGLEPERGLMQEVSRYRDYLTSVPPARLFDEVLKFFHHTHGVNSWHALRTTRFLDLLFPETVAALDTADGEPWERLILKALANTDRRVAQNKPVIAAFLYVVLLWRPFRLRLDALKGAENNFGNLAWQAADQVFAETCQQVAIPRRVSSVVLDIWEMQSALERRRPRNIEQILMNRRFRAAYDFLMLRGEVGEIPQELVNWWTRIQDVGMAEQKRMIQQLSRTGPSRHPKGRRRRSRRKPEMKQAIGWGPN